MPNFSKRRFSLNSAAETLINTRRRFFPEVITTAGVIQTQLQLDLCIINIGCLIVLTLKLSGFIDLMFETQRSSCWKSAMEKYWVEHRKCSFFHFCWLLNTQNWLSIEFPKQTNQFPPKIKKKSRASLKEMAAPSEKSAADFWWNIRRKWSCYQSLERVINTQQFKIKKIRSFFYFWKTSHQDNFRNQSFFYKTKPQKFTTPSCEEICNFLLNKAFSQ